MINESDNTWYNTSTIQYKHVWVGYEVRYGMAHTWARHDLEF